MTKHKQAAAGGQQGRTNLFSLGTLMKLPATLSTLRTFLDAVNWNAAESEIRSELRRKIVIAGLPNVGKSTLFNQFKGKNISPVSAVAGTTRSLIEGTFGPFTVIDTPGHAVNLQEAVANEAAVILLVLDASRPVNDADRALFVRLKALGRPLLVAVNKSDAVEGDAEQFAARYAARLGADHAIPISARTGENIAEDLIPALIEASPEAALAIGHELPMYRRIAADRIVRNAALLGLAAGLEPIPLIDIPLLLGNQVRMVLRVAAIYGEPVGSQYLVELFSTIASGLALRYLASEAAKAIPFGGDLVSGAIAAAGTWAIGMVAIEYFEQDKQLSAGQLRTLFRRFYDRFRLAQRQEDLPQLLEGEAS